MTSSTKKLCFCNLTYVVWAFVVYKVLNNGMFLTQRDLFLQLANNNTIHHSPGYWVYNYALYVLMRFKLSITFLQRD